MHHFLRRQGNADFRQFLDDADRPIRAQGFGLREQAETRTRLRPDVLRGAEEGRQRSPPVGSADGRTGGQSRIEAVGREPRKNRRRQNQRPGETRFRQRGWNEDMVSKDEEDINNNNNNNNNENTDSNNNEDNNNNDD